MPYIYDSTLWNEKVSNLQLIDYDMLKKVVDGLLIYKSCLSSLIQKWNEKLERKVVKNCEKLLFKVIFPTISSTFVDDQANNLDHFVVFSFLSF